MARPFTFSVETRLWHPSEGWKTFPAGETDPGAMWSEKEGGNPVGSQATAGALRDLIEANDRLDAAAQREARKDHDLAALAAERDEARGKLADLEQRTIAAGKAQVQAEDAARGYMLERDAARSEVQTLRDSLARAAKAPAKAVAAT